MTLILGVSRFDGVYLCVDHRLSSSNGMVVHDDHTSKYMRLVFPPLDGSGPNATLAFTGVAELLEERIGTVDWIRETLRGKTETLQTALEHLRLRLTRDVGARPLVVAMFVTQGTQRWFGGLTNIDAITGGPRTEFGVGFDELDRLFWAASGGAAAGAHSEVIEAGLNALLEDRSLIPLECMAHIAAVNRSVHRLERTVSASCQVGFVPDADWPERHSLEREYRADGSVVHGVMPAILVGRSRPETPCWTTSTRDGRDSKRAGRFRI